MRWSEWLHARVGRTDSIALVRLMQLLFNFLTAELGLDPQQTAEVMWQDYQRGGRKRTLYRSYWLQRVWESSHRRFSWRRQSFCRPQKRSTDQQTRPWELVSAQRQVLRCAPVD